MGQRYKSHTNTTIQPWNVKGWEASILGDILPMTARWDGWNSFLGQGKPRRGRSCICDRQIITRGVQPPWGRQRSKGRVTGREKESPGQSLMEKKKLAVSCRGMGGETEMDTHNPAKSSWWVEAYCAFSQTSKTADCLLASLWVLFRIDDVPDLIVAYKQRQTMFMRTELMAKHAHVRPQSIICLSREVQSYSGLRRKYLKAMFIIYTLCKTPT